MIHKGEIYITDRYRGGKKDYGRPVLVLSSSDSIRETGFALVAPMARRECFSGTPHVPVSDFKGRPYVVILERTKGLPERILRANTGYLPRREMIRVEGGLCRLLEL